MLLAWQLPEKRGELLKLVEDDIQKLSTDVVVSDEPSVSQISSRTKQELSEGVQIDCMRESRREGGDLSLSLSHTQCALLADWRKKS